MSDYSRRRQNNTTLASMRAHVSAIRSDAKEAAVEAIAVGWAAQHTLSELAAEAQTLVQKLSRVNFLSKEAQTLLKRLAALRSESAKRGQVLYNIGKGKSEYEMVLLDILYAPEQPGSRLNWSEISLAVHPISVTQKQQNLAMSYEYSYGPGIAPPDNQMWLWIAQDPDNTGLLWDVRRYIFLNPLLPNMLARIKRSAPTTRGLPPWESIAKWWNIGVAAVKRESTLLRMQGLPSIDDVVYDGDANPGLPWSIMPPVEGSGVPYTQVKQILGEVRGQGPSAVYVPPIPQWGLAVKAFRKRAIFGLTDKKDPNWEPLNLVWSLQAGNVKHVLREEAETKPNRCIFNCPLMLRMFEGAIAQPFYKNWRHPGSLLGASFAHGGTTEILQRVLGIPLSTSEEERKNKIFEICELGPGPPGARPEVRSLLIKPGFGQIAFPDKVEYDLSTRRQPMEDFARYQEGVLPARRAGATPEEQKFNHGIDAWGKIHHFTAQKNIEKKVLTNCRAVLNMDWANPSGSANTANRNTWGNLAGEKAASAFVYSKFNPNREPDLSFCVITAAGDDASLYYKGELNGGMPLPEIQKWHDARDEILAKIGWNYKPETRGLGPNLSGFELLGRHIYAWVESRSNGTEECLGFFGLRDEMKIFRSLAMPKKPYEKGVARQNIQLARVHAAADEGFAYNRVYRTCGRISHKLKTDFTARMPAYAYDVTDIFFNVPPVDHVRSMAEMLKLHLGIDVSVGTHESSGSEEDEIPAFAAEMLDALEDDTLVSRPPPAAAGKVPPRPKKPAASLPVQDVLETLHADTEAVLAQLAALDDI
jgi:hypothetical protein